MARIGTAVAAVVWLLAASEAEVSDVTTIYSFDHPGDNKVSFAELPNFDLRDIKYCSTVCKWKTDGWKSMDRSMPEIDVAVLGLDNDFGVLETSTYLQYHEAAVCVTIDYHIAPLSKATIDIIMVDYDEEISLGKVTSLNEELPNSWMKRRFIGIVRRDSSRSITLKFVAQRTQRGSVFIRNITGCNEAEIVETTVNRAGSTEIHARNNALGLPFISQDGFVYYPNAEVDVQTCSGLNCTWKATNFTFIKRLPLSWEHVDYIIKPLSSSTVSSNFFKFDGNIDLTFETPDDTGHLYIYLTDKLQNLQNSKMYVITINTHEHEYHTLHRCDPWRYNGYYNPIPGANRYDCALVSTKKPYGKLLSNVTYNINVRQENGKLEVVVQNGTYRGVLLSIQDTEPINTTHFKAALNNMKGTLVANEFGSWIPEQDMGSLVSPPFVPHQNKVCVAVTYKGAAKLNLLQSDEVVEFSSVQKTFLDSTWRTKVFLADVTDKSGSTVSVQLVAEDRIEVALITGCSGEDLESIHVVSSSSAKTYTIKYQAYDVAVNVNASYINGSTHSCINGGIFDSESKGCVCPPGFTGDSCERGCGPNKYGSDCGGRCSESTRGCKGMILCRPKLGCNCAPGFKGVLCDHPCDYGQYGAGCKQLCGKCPKGNHCDSYTGECDYDDCQDGFYPPLCHQTYRYISEDPEVVSRDFFTLQINFKTDESHLEGVGSPRFYQIQLKNVNETCDYTWTELVPHLLPADEVVVSNITGLEAGTHYKVRVVLLDEDGNSYQGEKVPVLLTNTKCTVPSVVHYQFNSSDITTGEFIVSWNYTRENNTWCKATHSEVELLRNRGWIQQYKGLRESYQFSKLLPGEKYKIRVRVVTPEGPAPFSDVLSVTTLSKAPEKVSNLHLVTSKPRALEVKWDKPLFTGGNVHRYKVSYMCLELFACPDQRSCSYVSNGKSEVTTTSAVLHNLLPHTQYAIEVSAMSVSWGPKSKLLAVTAMTEPEVSPEPSSTSPLTHRTNSSMEVHWEPPQNCSGLNGYLYGYRYQLLGHNVSLEGSTDLTKATFTDLTPHTQYTVKVFALTSGGWNAQYPLIISENTSATVPSPVEQLTVYKRGRRMLGIRWAAPNETYGALKSFNISYKLEGQNPVSYVINLTSCIAWPHLYCHTLHSLQQDTMYKVQVQARNNEVNEDGESVSVDAFTRESAPLAPSFVRVLSQTETNLTVQWGIPEMLNGQMRSFVVNIEETDSINSTDCCQYFPIQEVAVRSEQPDYRIQVSSLRPASTYAISIAAKTMSLGPPVTITAHTRAPVPSMSNMLTIPDGSNHLSSEPTIKIRPSTENVQLIKGYLLLVLPQSTTENTTSEIWDERLAQELAQHINRTYYIAAEFKGDLQETSEVVVGTGREMTTGKWGQVQDPVLEDGATYRFGLVLLLEYCGVFGVGYTETQPFVIQSS